jgi:hypothetical protein
VSRPLSPADVRRVLKASCDAAGGQALWAARHGISPELVSNALRGHRGLSPRIIAPLGLRAREPSYEPAPEVRS